MFVVDANTQSFLHTTLRDLDLAVLHRPVIERPAPNGDRLAFGCSS